ncbi:hypothetical protein BGX26_010486, partial [Mortierella sp. AD094]
MCVVVVYKLDDAKLAKLQVKTLKRYLSAYNISTAGMIEKPELIKAIQERRPVPESSEIYFRDNMPKTVEDWKLLLEELPSASNVSGSSEGLISDLDKFFSKIFGGDDAKSRKRIPPQPQQSSKPQAQPTPSRSTSSSSSSRPSTGSKPEPQPSAGPTPAPQPSAGPSPTPNTSARPTPAPQPSAGPKPAPQPFATAQPHFQPQSHYQPKPQGATAGARPYPQTQAPPTSNGP